MSAAKSTVLVVGATGSIGRLVVAEALRQGHAVRALVRDPDRARGLPAEAERVVGDLTQPQTLTAAVAGIDAVVFTHGSDGGGKGAAEQVDYGGVRNVLLALDGRPVRIALMTAIGVTNREGAYNRATQAHDWKHRGERLVRASGLPYTIVRPGWFDLEASDQQRLVLLQGDRRWAGNPSDGVVARRQIAEVLVRSLTSNAACRKTFELVAEHGPATSDFEALFAACDADASADAEGAPDAVYDAANMALADEPARVRDDLAGVTKTPQR
ncbi:MAG TPA: SDR family oxidoreductase [Burkholderiaceae bacterium]|nr:SDR family oxidoreductase [Burkholderiaceae bacterium]